MTSRKTTGVLVFLIPLALGAMASGWVPMLPAIENEFGISRTALNLASLGGLVAGLVAGPVVDWKGSRLLIVAGGLVAALGLLIFSTASGLPIALTGGFLTSAGVGLAGGVVIRVLVADWFIRYRGTFLGLALLGSGLGFLFAPVVGLLVEEGTWRIAARVLTLWGVGVAVAGFTLIHSSPTKGEEDDPSKVRVPGRRSPQLERMIPAGQYVRSPGLRPSLVLLGLASAGVLWVISGLTTTGEWVLFDLSGSTDFNALLPIGIVVGGAVFSMAADFWARRRMLWVGGSGAVVALVVLSLFPSPIAIGLVRTLLFLAGLFLGGLGALIVLTFVDYMGVKLLGTLSIAFGLLSGVGGALGAIVAGFLVDEFGPFPWAFLILVPLVGLAVLAATKAPYPVVGLQRQASTV